MGSGDKTKSYFDKEYADFDASYNEGRGIKDIVRLLTYSVNKKAISGRLNALLELVGDNINNARILEVGCGPGIYSVRLTQRGARVTALDYSRGMVDAAKKNAEASGVDINFILGDFMELNSESMFDYVFATGVIEYIEPVRHIDFLKKMRAASNRYVIVSFPKKYSLHALIRNIWLRFFKGIKVSFFSNKDIGRLAGLSGLNESGRIDVGILWVIKFEKLGQVR